QIESSGILTQVAVTSNTDTSSQDAFSGGGGPTDNTSVKLTDTLVEQIRKIGHVSGVNPVLGVYQLQSFTVEGGDGKKISTHGAVGVQPGPDSDKTLLAGRNLKPDDHSGVIIFPARFLDK